MIQVCVRPEDVKKVRGLILSLAISGKLTSKEVSSGDISGTFLIPLDWKWCTLSEIAACRGSAKAGSDGIKPSDWILDMEDIDGATGTVHTRATFKERSSLSTKSAFKPGDVLYGKLRPYLNKVVLADSTGFCTTEIIPITPGATIEARYLQIVLRSPYFLEYVTKRSYGMKMPRLGTKDLESARIPLPPLAEQKRIIAKVDELMALCDRLEAQLKERDVRQAALANAALAKFTEDPTPENLQLLFHPSFSIEPEDLRKLVLNLAIQGKLVAQDPKDESAEHLFEKILTHKSGAKKTRAGSEVFGKPKNKEKDDRPIPDGWIWTSFGEIVVNRDGERIPVSKEIRETKAKLYDYYGASGVIDKIDSYIFSSPLLLIGEDGANLINRSTPIAFIARGHYWVNNHAHVLDGISEDFLKYLEIYINAINLEAYVTGSAQPKMNQAKLNSIPVALPPMDEQKRIIAKVHDLFELLSNLEAQIEASRTTGEKLLEAMVAELTSA